MADCFGGEGLGIGVLFFPKEDIQFTFFSPSPGFLTSLFLAKISMAAILFYCKRTSSSSNIVALHPFDFDITNRIPFSFERERKVEGRGEGHRKTGARDDGGEKKLNFLFWKYQIIGRASARQLVLINERRRPKKRSFGVGRVVVFEIKITILRTRY